MSSKNRCDPNGDVGARADCVLIAASSRPIIAIKGYVSPVVHTLSNMSALLQNTRGRDDLRDGAYRHFTSFATYAKLA